MDEPSRSILDRIGVCSWSLKPRSPAALGRKVESIGARSVQLALDPLRTGAWSEAATVRELARYGIEIRSGMIAMQGEDYTSIASIRRTGGLRPAQLWPQNRAACVDNAHLARRLGIRLVSFHAGLVPESRLHPDRGSLVPRLRAVADIFAAQGVHIALETGQEPPSVLLDLIDELDRPTVGVNFDPANLLLYDTGDPIEALRVLAPHVRQIHVKDARSSGNSRVWGEEVRVGTGEVDWAAFFDVVADAELDCDFMIEREAGRDRVMDIRLAGQLVERHLRSRLEAVEPAG